MQKKKKILIVDDEKQLVSLVSLHMNMSGYEVLSANDGEKALAIARGETPDLIILDLMLPKIDGWEVCKLLWSDKDEIEFGNIDVHIRHLREKLEIDPENPQIIKTIKGAGYIVEGMAYV
ncbi:MAG: response regulator [Candidatus Omnitrophica bacterium]|nr:response regulator [Candidatus Omnitrophota bacterium]